MNLKQRRDAYSYPTVGLSGTVVAHSHVAFGTSLEMDEHHARLLRSDADDEVLLGYLSTLYWGHFAGSDGRMTAKRALSRVEAAINGSSFKRKGITYRRQGIDDLGSGKAVALIREAMCLVDAHNYGEAVKVLCALPQLGFAFASKVVAFLAPNTCGVIDSVIAEKYPIYGFKLRGRYVSDVKENFQCYQAYCLALSTEAGIQNKLGVNAYWQERNGELRPWRAVDVERAMYGL